MQCRYMREASFALKFCYLGNKYCHLLGLCPPLPVDCDVRRALPPLPDLVHEVVVSTCPPPGGAHPAAQPREAAAVAAEALRNKMTYNHHNNLFILLLYRYHRTCPRDERVPRWFLRPPGPPPPGPPSRDKKEKKMSTSPSLCPGAFFPRVSKPRWGGSYVRRSQGAGGFVRT